MHRFLAIGAACLLAMVLSGNAAAWSWPADGAVLRPFSLGADAYAAGQHRGIDVAGAEGSPVLAAASGTVTFAGSLPTHGRGVTILTNDGYAVTLVHLGSISVEKGAAVTEGDTIGLMGWSGTPEHGVPTVHLGIRRADQAEGYVDPLGLLPPRSSMPAPAPPPPPASAPAPTPAPAPRATSPTQPAPTAPVTPTAPGPAPVPSTPPSQAAEMPAAQAQPAASPSSEVAAPALTRADPSPAPGGASQTPVTAPGVARAAQPVVGKGDAFVVTNDRRARVVGRRAPATVAEQPVTSVVDGTSRALPSEGRRPEIVGPGDGRERSFVRGVEVDSGAVRSAVAVARAAEREVPDGPPVRPIPAGSSRSRADEAGRLVTAVPEARPQPGGGAAVRPQPSLHAERASSGTEAATPAGETKAPLGPLAAAFALGVLAVVGLRRAARRIDRDGAVLPHDADLLRELDPAHRARVHDRGGGRVRAPSASARA